MTNRLRYYANCVNWPADDVHTDGGLVAMVNVAEQVTRTTFLSHVNQGEMRWLEACLGYASHHRKGLMMVNDRHVSYHRSQLNGERVYFFKHSAIEYVFTAKGKS